MRSVFRTLFVGLLGLMAASCAQSELAGEPSGGSGPMSRVAFSASVNPQYSLSYASAETSGVDLDQIAWPAGSDFALDILSGGSVVESHAAGAVPSELELAVGAYSVRAHSGVNGESWNTPYLAGEEEFSLSSSATSVNAKLTCGLKSTLVALVFDENFSTIFSDYTAYLNTDHTQEAWVWAAGEKRVACMRPTEQLLIRVDVTMRSNGSKYNYGINPLVGLKAGELNVVRFSMVGGEVTTTITSDNTVTVVEKTVMLQADWLATRKTSISATFDPAVSVEHIYGLPYTTPMDVVVRSNVGLKSLKLKASGDLATLLGATEVDLRGVNEVEAKTGLVLTQNEAEMAYDGRLNFKRCLNTLPVLAGDASAYTFTVEAVDLLDNVVPFDTKINISLPEWQIDASEWWNRYAYVSTLRITDAGVPEAMREQFAFDYVIRKGTGEWEPMGEGRYAGAQRIYLNGLEPGTLYTAAADLGNGRYETVATFTTDVEPQIPNGDFSQATLPPQANGNIDAYYEPTGWATLNALTTQNYSTSAKASQAYPCVKVENGAAVLTTRGWGGKSIIKHGKDGFDKDIFTEAYDQATEGKIFLGSYDYASKQEIHGAVIDKRPKEISFGYNYTPKAGAWEVVLQILSSEIVMGVAQMSSSEFGTGNIILPITYDAANLALQPTTIWLSFSCQKGEPMANKDYLTPIYGSHRSGYFSYIPWNWGTKWADSNNSYYVGSTLIVDNVELIYLQDITDSYTTK